MEACGVPKLNKSQGKTDEEFLEPPRSYWFASEFGLTSYLDLMFGHIGCMVLPNGKCVSHLMVRLCQNKTEKMKGEMGGDGE